MEHTITAIWIAATGLGGLAIGYSTALFAYKQGEKADRIKMLIAEGPKLVQMVSNVISNVRDIIEANNANKRS